MTGPTPRPQCAEIMISQGLRARTVADAGHDSAGHHHLFHMSRSVLIHFTDPRVRKHTPKHLCMKRRHPSSGTGAALLPQFVRDPHREFSVTNSRSAFTNP